MPQIFSGLLGGGNASGNQFKADEGIAGGMMGPTAVTNGGQQDAAYFNSDAALVNQNNFVNALQGQNGIQNQSNVFNALGNVANGTGPNPAQAMLNQATTQNIQNAASTFASQKGITNPGLAARQAAQIGAQTQQNAAGQAATMQANQSLAALGQQAGIAGQQVANQAGAISTQNQAAQGFQGLVNTAAQNQNANLINMQSNINNANAGIQSQNAKAQNDAGAGIIKGIGSAITMAKGGQVPKNFDTGGVASSAPTPDSSFGPKSMFGKFLKGASSDQNVNGSGLGGESSASAGAGNAVGSVLGSGLRSVGEALGITPAKEQAIDLGDPNIDLGEINGGQDTVGAGAASSGEDEVAQSMTPDVGGFMARGGKVPAMVSPGERYIPPKEAKKVAKGEKSPMKAGEKIPGKAKVKGDSLKNDTVPKTLEEGGIVIPRSVMNSKDPKKEAAKFVAAHMKSLAKGGKV